MSGLVLVTGASGFVGRDLVARLAAAGWIVRAAARDPATLLRTSAIEAVGLPDLAEASIDWQPLLRDVTHVVHLAGIAHATRAIPEVTYMAVNAAAVGSLAAAARGTSVRRMVLVSSIRAQVGPAATAVVREQDPPRPTDAYGRSKLAGEQAMWRALAGSSTAGVVLRPVLVYGPAVKGNMARLLRLARSRWPLPLAGLSGRRSLVSLVNLASATGHVLQAPQTAGGTFLVADPHPVSATDIIRILRLSLGRRPGLLPVPLAPARVALQMLGRGDTWARLNGDLVADTSALAATGWQPPQTTEAALVEMLEA